VSGKSRKEERHCEDEARSNPGRKEMDCRAAIAARNDAYDFATSTPSLRGQSPKQSKKNRYSFKSICITKNDVYLCHQINTPYI
jgi:hypothetical protein